jgi:hypothetical protein
MTALGVLLLEIAAVLGYGAMLLRALGLFDELEPGLRAPMAFAFGLGLLGWLVLPLGWAGRLEPAFLLLLLGTGCLGLPLLRRACWTPPRLDRPGLLLAALLLAVFALSLAQALAPPADGDTLAYHFTRIKEAIRAGHWVFTPQAVEGSAPLLAQSTYLPALALGGERALTLWTMASGLAPAWLLYQLARRALSVNHALLLALLLLTLPAMVYGAGSGQAEARNMLFALAGGALIASSPRPCLRRALAAGLCAGFYLGTKLFGLFFVAAAGFVLLARSRSPLLGLAFGLAAILAGFEWYLWNWAHSGDPVFPMLLTWTQASESALWNPDHGRDLLATLASAEQPLAPSLGLFFAYPFLATLGGPNIWEAGRTGFGPLFLLILPFALAGLAMRGRAAIRGELFALAAIAFLFYLFWFFFGTAQRVRHLLPVLPLLLLPVAVAATSAVGQGVLAKPLTLAILATLALQVAGMALFSLGPLNFALSRESRSSYLARNVPNFQAVAPLNQQLAQGGKVLLAERQLLYYLDVPYHFGHAVHQSLVDLRPQAPDDNAKRWRQVQSLGITHILIVPGLEADPDSSPLARLAQALLKAGCILHREELPAQSFTSRTLPALQGGSGQATLLKLSPLACDSGRL